GWRGAAPSLLPDPHRQMARRARRARGREGQAAVPLLREGIHARPLDEPGSDRSALRGGVRHPRAHGRDSARAGERLNVERSPLAIDTDDGRCLRAELLLPERPRAAAVLAHAMMVNRRTMDRPSGSGLASTLATHGLAVMNIDLRGHGESSP